MIHSLWRTVWRFLKGKLKIKLPYGPVIPLLAIYPEKDVIPEKKTGMSIFIAVLFMIARTWKQPNRPPTDG